MSREPVARWNRRKLSFNEKIPRLTGRSCGEFPGIGRTLPSRHFLLVARLPSLTFLPICDPTPVRLARFSAPSLSQNSYSSRGRAGCHDAFGRAFLVERLSPCPLPRTLSPPNTVRHSAPPTIR